MTLSALRHDALTATATGFALRIALPWIRSLPLSSILDLAVDIDSTAVEDLRVHTRGDAIETERLADLTGWWFIQDRLVATGSRRVDGSPHRVTVSFRMRIPYLSAGPDGPVELPIRDEMLLTPTAPVVSASRDVA